jgi:hypothetical protein
VAASATFVIDDVDPEGVGFKDRTSALPVGGNTGATVGEQRRIAVQYAADIWGKLLNSPVPIVIQASFKEMPCTDTGVASLGQASPWGVATNIIECGADPQVYYPSALANRLVGEDLSPEGPDIVAEFNGALGSSLCLPDLKWYYGLDGASGADLDLITVVLHELGHGLGFTNFVDMETGEFLGKPSNQPRPDIYTKYTFDKTVGKTWAQMTATERLSSAANVRGVVWNGPNVTAQAPHVLDRGTPTLTLSPSLPAFSGLLGEANFGPALSSLGAPIEAQLVLGAPEDGCERLTNADGKVALLLESGACHFFNMVNRAEYGQSGGAVAVLIGREVPPDRPPTPLDAESQDLALFNSVTNIPSFTIPLSDATLLKTELNSGRAITVTLRSDPSLLAGADRSGNVFLYASDPVDTGSSIAHWDPLVRPNLLMEPNLVHRESSHEVDLSVALLNDIGWGTVCDGGRPEPTDVVKDAGGDLQGSCATNCADGSAEGDAALVDGSAKAANEGGAKDGAVNAIGAAGGAENTHGAAGGAGGYIGLDAGSGIPTPTKAAKDNAPVNTASAEPSRQGGQGTSCTCRIATGPVPHRQGAYFLFLPPLLLLGRVTKRRYFRDPKRI